MCENKNKQTITVRMRICMLLTWISFYFPRKIHFKYEKVGWRFDWDTFLDYRVWTRSFWKYLLSNRVVFSRGTFDFESPLLCGCSGTVILLPPITHASDEHVWNECSCDHIVGDRTCRVRFEPFLNRESLESKPIFRGPRVLKQSQCDWAN